MPQRPWVLLQLELSKNGGVIVLPDNCCCCAALKVKGHINAPLKSIYTQSFTDGLEKSKRPQVKDRKQKTGINIPL